MRHFLLGPVVLIALVLPAAAEDRSCRGEPTEITFSHYEDAPQANVECSGGLVGAMDCVAEKMANAADPGRLGATYKVKVTPVVEVLPDGRMRVKLDVADPEFQSSPGLPAETRNRALREVRVLQAKLNLFEAVLPLEGTGGGSQPGDEAAAESPPADEMAPVEVMLLPFAPDKALPRKTMMASKSILDTILGRAAAGPEGNAAEGHPPEPLKPIPIPLLDEALLTAEGEASAELCDPFAPAAGELPQGVDFEIVPGDQPGEWFLRWRLPDGSVAESALADYVDPETGARTVLEANPFGDVRESTLWPDGTLTTDRLWPEGDQSTSVFSPDGSFEHVVREPDGSFTHQTVEPDGSIVTERRDADGGLIETVTQRPDGWMERVDGGGNYSATRADDEGTIVVETDRSGNTRTAHFDRYGNLTEQGGHQLYASEPGRDYFEKELGGTDWDQLPEHLKRRYAESERAIDEKLLSRAREDARAAQDRREAAERDALDAGARAETERKLAEIVAEQEAADRRAAERQAKWDRQQAIEASSEKARELEQQYDEAEARGDRDAMQRIIAEQDAHHEASHALLQPTDEEARAMDEETALRQRLSDQVRTRAAAIAEADVAGELAEHDAWDAVNSKTKYVSVGAEMRQETSAGTRLALRERADARARQAEIDRMLADPATTDAERAVLLDMLESARIKEEGASQLLIDNDRIAAAGYAVDVAATVTGAKLAAGATTAVNAASRAAAGTALRVLPASAGRMTANGMLAVGKNLAERGALDAAGRTATATTVGVTRLVVGEEAAKGVARALGTDVGTPIVNALSRGARSMAGDTAVDTAKAGLARVAAAAGTDVGEIATRIRQVTGQTAKEGGEVVVHGSGSQAAGRSVADDAAKVSRNVDTPAPRPDPKAETVDLPQPARSPDKMSPAERQAYHDARARQQMRSNSDPITDPGDDVLPGPSATPARPFTREEVARLHNPGRPLTQAEVVRKGELYTERELARKAYAEAVSARKPAEELASLRGRHDELNRMILDGQGVEAYAPNPMPEPLPWARRSSEDLSDTAIIRAPERPDRAIGGADGNIGPSGTDRYAASRQAGALPPPVSGPQSAKRAAGLGTDPARARADWARMPQQARAQVADDMLRRIEQEAGSGNPAARQVQNALEDGSLTFELDPAAAQPRRSLENGRAILDPTDGSRMRSGEELAELAIQPRPVSPRTRSPRFDGLDTPEGLERAASPDGLLPAERAQLKQLDLRIDEKKNEFVLGEAAERKRLTELTALRHQRRSLVDHGLDYRRRSELRARQDAASNYRVPDGTPGAAQPQRHAEHGSVPLRQLVAGDQDYVANIMGPNIRPSQKDIYASTVNRNVQQILDGGPFPGSRDGGKIRLAKVGDHDYVILQGHHRMVSAQISSRLTGRPLLPSQATGGVRSVIPVEHLEIVTSSDRVAANWRTMGVRPDP